MSSFKVGLLKDTFSIILMINTNTLFIALFITFIIIFTFVIYFVFLITKFFKPTLPDFPTPSKTKTGKEYSIENPEVIIIGAGVVGATMAVKFGEQGRFVQVIERQVEASPRIVGEFLQPAGFHKLVELGLDRVLIFIFLKRLLTLFLIKPRLC